MIMHSEVNHKLDVFLVAIYLLNALSLTLQRKVDIQGLAMIG